MLKQRKRQHDRESTDTEIDSIAAPVERPSDELVRQLHVIAEVSPASRAVLVLHFAEDLPLSDVAAILEIPLGTVKSRLAYGLAAIRKQLEHDRRL